MSNFFLWYRMLPFSWNESAACLILEKLHCFLSCRLDIASKRGQQTSTETTHFVLHVNLFQGIISTEPLYLTVIMFEAFNLLPIHSHSKTSLWFVPFSLCFLSNKRNEPKLLLNHIWKQLLRCESVIRHTKGCSGVSAEGTDSTLHSHSCSLQGTYSM